jgi:hypothetical protein
LALSSSGDAATSTLSLATFVGVTVYILHRAVLYPILEQLFSIGVIDRFRRRWPLISRRSLNVLGDLWSAGAESGKQAEAIARQIAIWGDYTHMLYVSALCVVAGSLLRTLTTPARYEFSWTLAIAVLVLASAGLISNWRLHAVREYLLPKRAQSSGQSDA